MPRPATGSCFESQTNVFISGKQFRPDMLAIGSTMKKEMLEYTLYGAMQMSFEETVSVFVRYKSLANHQMAYCSTGFFSFIPNVLRCYQ